MAKKTYTKKTYSHKDLTNALAKAEVSKALSLGCNAGMMYFGIRMATTKIKNITEHPSSYGRSSITDLLDSSYTTGNETEKMIRQIRKNYGDHSVARDLLKYLNEFKTEHSALCKKLDYTVQKKVKKHKK
ncbi:MAG: hypothetical protein PHH54_05035 [Candidatus Nanoarchaeia archaeon]|nr:hypothetical protein [Candidatus Nanoarchaeia archaeon]MDD5741323.1 hypothetical protein [Candidatus Nanoarchaeia archaeon]